MTPTPAHDDLTDRLTRARRLAADATARHCADPTDISLRIGRAAVRQCMIAERRWINNAYTVNGHYTATAPAIP